VPATRPEERRTKWNRVTMPDYEKIAVELYEACELAYRGIDKSEYGSYDVMLEAKAVLLQIMVKYEDLLDRDGEE